MLAWIVSQIAGKFLPRRRPWMINCLVIIPNYARVNTGPSMQAIQEYWIESVSCTSSTTKCVNSVAAFFLNASGPRQNERVFQVSDLVFLTYCLVCIEQVDCWRVWRTEMMSVSISLPIASWQIQPPSIGMAPLTPSRPCDYRTLCRANQHLALPTDHVQCIRIKPWKVLISTLSWSFLLTDV